jgi:ubiquinone/menaquinone biosynthesis C-methylase UbiE
MNEHADERLVPEISDYATLWEHVARYALACQYVAGKSVLDIASGEGYGTYALSQTAENVVGVDVDEESVVRAQRKYGLDYRIGNAEQIPLANSSVDCVVSFETLEHLQDASNFVSEVRRILKPNGTFLLSTPNKDVYHSGTTSNPYHTREYSLEELLGMLNPSFTVASVFGQGFSASPIDHIERWIGFVSKGLQSGFHNFITRRLRNRYTPGVITTSPTDLRNFIESIPTFHRSFLWWFHRACLRRVSANQNLGCTYFLVVAFKK